MYGGIHILPDNLDGRHIGSQTCQQALIWVTQNVRTLHDLTL